LEFFAHQSDPFPKTANGRSLRNATAHRLDCSLDTASAAKQVFLLFCSAFRRGVVSSQTD
jgi:hypothetical protein